jgi:predicted permease
MRPISPDYFRALGVSMRRGRTFENRDAAESLPVAIVSETAAWRFWPGEDPVGKRIRMHVSAVAGREPFREIVGVVSDVRTGPLQARIPPVVYVPHAQHPSSVMSLMIRGAGDPGAFAGSVVAALAEIDRGVVPLGIEPLEDHVAASRADWRFRAMVLGLFAGSAVFLALAGLYAVVSYAAAQRRHELGVRLALGATRRDIVRLVVGEGMQPVAVGLVLGCGGSLGMSRAMTGLLFGTRPIEPGVIAAVALTFAAATTIACYVPARRAAGSDPREALRSE